MAKQPDLSKAIRLVYRELLTRDATPDEIKEGREIVQAAETPREGIADLRWILFNCNEFRFLP